jgi:hypothetical protein
MTAATWHGRRGSVLLGPTEDRVARYLDAATRYGRISLRTVELAERLRLERSEAYRITARLRVLGLFGIENDRGGTKGGRRIWRTLTESDDGALDSTRHRVAWARIVAWARARSGRVRARLAALRGDHTRSDARPVPARRATSPAPDDRSSPCRSDGAGGGNGPPDDRGPGGPSFAERMRRAGLGELMDAWGV